MKIRTIGQRCEVRKGGGFLMFIGLPFVLFGGAMVIGGIGQLMNHNFDGYVVVPFGSIFLIIGLCLMFGRSGVIIDRGAHTVQTWWGLLFPFRRKDLKLTGFSEVHVCKEVRRTSSGNGGSSTKTVYPVRLVGDDTVGVQEFSTPLPARRVAEEVARVTELPMRNSITGVDVVREPHQLDWSLRRHLEYRSERPTEPEIPTGLKVAKRDDAYRVELKSSGWLGLVMLGMMLIPFLAMPLLFIVFAGGKAMKGGFGTAMMIFIAVPMVIGVVTFLAKAVTGHILEVSPSRVRVTTKRIIGSKVVDFDAESLEELTVSGSPMSGLLGALGGGGVTLVTDDLFVTVGAGRPSAELQYLNDLICYVVSQ